MDKEELILKCVSILEGYNLPAKEVMKEDHIQLKNARIYFLSEIITIIAGEIFDEFEKLNLIPPDKYEDWCEFKALRGRWEK